MERLAPSLAKFITGVGQYVAMTMFANRTTHAHIFGKASCTNLHLRNVAEHVVTISCQPKVPGMLQGLGKILDFDAFSFAFIPNMARKFYNISRFRIGKRFHYTPCDV